MGFYVKGSALRLIPRLFLILKSVKEKHLFDEQIAAESLAMLHH